MKRVKFGDMLTVTEGIIVHGCNAQGVMGSGIAAQIRAKWPECYETYRDAFAGQTSSDMMGQVIAYGVPDYDLVIANAITQEHFGRDHIKYVSYKAIHEVFSTVCTAALTSGMSVHYPLIGAGLGGGDWSIISDIIDECFFDYPEIERTLWVFE